ncbi:MAG: hypothetical protein IJ725_02125, partial [Ruminococcus sp.]|nr:hypothetical protein [Ruminococcus sp.]
MKNKKSIEESQKIDISAQASTNEEDEKRFRLEQILAETRFISEQDAMRKAAEKYGARPQMDEIFSTTDKKVRLTNSNPLELDDEEKKDTNAIQGEKNATTMQAEIMMENFDNDNNVINLTPEIPEGAKVAEDVIEDSPELSEVDPEIGSMFSAGDDSFDILRQKGDKASGNYEKKFGVKKPAPDAKTVESKVPVYKKNNDIDEIHLKAGRFSQVVRGEYEHYLRSKNPSISEVIKTEMAKVEEVR